MELNRMQLLLCESYGCNNKYKQKHDSTYRFVVCLTLTKKKRQYLFNHILQQNLLCKNFITNCFFHLCSFLFCKITFEKKRQRFLYNNMSLKLRVKSFLPFNGIIFCPASTSAFATYSTG